MSTLFFLRCASLIPYFLAYVGLRSLWCIEWLARHGLPCVFSDDSEFLSSKMHTKLARVLDVPGTCQRISRALVHILFPSVTRREDCIYNRYTEEGDKELNEMKEEMKGCKAMLASLRRQRLVYIEHLQTEEFLSLLEQSQRLQSHLDDLKKDIEERRISSQTQAVVEKTGYHGFVDWAERVSKTNENVLETTAQVGFVGAGLTYGTIFSASRGNVGLMAYAFALFVCGFIIPTVALALLKWASLRPKDTVFTAPHTWTLALHIATYTAIAAVGSAICLLNMTLYLLTFSLDSNGERQDAGLQLYISPRPAGSVSLGGLSFSVGMVLFCVGRHYTARGWDAFVRDSFGHHQII